MLMIKYKQPTHIDTHGRQHYLIRGIRWSEANEEKVKQLGYEYSIVEHEPHVPEWKKKATADDVLDTLLGVSE